MSGTQNTNSLPQLLYVEASVAINPPGYTLVPATMTEIPVMTFEEARDELFRQMEQFNDEELCEGRTGEVIYFDPATREPACIGIEARNDEVFREIEAAKSAVDLPSANFVDIEVKTWVLQGVVAEAAPNKNDGWWTAGDETYYSEEDAEAAMKEVVREALRQGGDWYRLPVDEAMEHISITMTEDMTEDYRGRRHPNPLVILVDATVPFHLTTESTGTE
jgi:hypothetical protein